jgi:hypothetical protein
MIFWARNKRTKGGEQWVSLEKFKEKKARAKESDRNRRARMELPPKKHKAGYVRPDGMVFWGRSRAKGEIWMTHERFRHERDSYNRHTRLKHANNEMCRKAQVWRAKVRQILRSDEDSRYKTAELLIGCSASEFREHMEKLFKEGMSWENRKEWHVDHRVPCASANSLEDLAKLFHFKNLQPLWVEDNHVKGTKTV